MSEKSKNTIIDLSTGEKYSIHDKRIPEVSIEDANKLIKVDEQGNLILE